MATAVKVYQNVQFNGGADLEYPRVHNVAGTSNLPSNAKIGTMAWNTSDNCMYVCYATSPAVAWKKFGAGGAVVEEDGTGAGVKVTAGTASTDGTVTYKIKAYDIKDTHIASNADITWSKLKAGAASSVMVTNASGVPTTTTILPVVNGGTGASTFTADRLLVGAGTGAITVLGQATSGYILYGNSSNKPVWTSRTGAGLALATGVSSSTGASAGWYRIAQSAAGIEKCFGLFRLHTTTSGIHNVILFTAGCSYGATASVNITQLSNTSYSPSGVTKLRIVYTPTYSNNRAYLELYDVTTAALAVQVRMIEGLGWTLVAPSTAGGIPTSPTNYTSKELTLTRQALQTSDEIKGVDLTASGTVTLSGLTTAGIVHNSASGVLSTSLVSLSADVTGTLPVAHGGIGASSLTANRLLVGNGTSAVSVLAQGTNDYVLVGRGSSVPAWVEKAPKATLADTASKVANKLTILRWKGDVEDWDTDIEYDGSSAHTIQIQTVYGNGILRGQGNGIVKYVYSSNVGRVLARVSTPELYDFVDVGTILPTIPNLQSGSTSEGYVLTVGAGTTYAPTWRQSVNQSIMPVGYDILAFCRYSLTTPTQKSTTDNSTYTDMTLSKALFMHDTATTLSLSATGIKGYRWTWASLNSTAARYFIIKVKYTANPPNFYARVTQNGTVLVTKKLNTAYTNIVDPGITLSGEVILDIYTDGTSGSINLCGIELISPRPGDQGYNERWLFPFVYDTSENIYPATNNVSTLGTTTYKWKNVYSNAFTGGTISGTTLTASSTVKFTGFTTAGVLHNASDGTISSSKVSMSSDVQGTLAVANGGTGTTTFTAHALLVGNGTSAVGTIGVGNSDYVLIGKGSGANPAWVEKAPKAVQADSVPWSGITGVPTQFTPTSHSHTYISVVDKRNEFPYNKIITTSKGVFASFMTNTKLGITSDGTYSDVIVISGYGDSTAGYDNALIFCKQSSSVYHTRFPFHSEDSWGTPVKFLDASNYTDYTVTKTGGGATGTGWTISITGSASSATDATNASKVNISASTSKLYVTGVLTSASGNSVIYKDTSVSVTGGTVTATTFSGSLSGGTISGTNLTASGTVKLTGLGTTAGVVHNASDGTLSSSLVSLSADVTGTLPVSKGGTGASSTTAYRVIAANSSANAYTVLGVATTNYVLVGNGGSALPTWQEKAPLASRANYADILRDPDYHTSSSRRTSANNTFADGGLHYYLASTSMTTGKPAEDGSILHCSWDQGKWDVQLFVGKNLLQYRAQNNVADWTGRNWVTVLDANNYTDYVKNGTLSLQANGTNVTTFTANQAGASTFNIGTGSSNGTISVGGTDVAVKGLGSNAYTSTAFLPLAGLKTVSGLTTFSAGLTVSGGDLTVKTLSGALYGDSGVVKASTTTATELGYVHGVTSAIQTQLDNKVTRYRVYNRDTNTTWNGSIPLWILSLKNGYPLYTDTEFETGSNSVSRYRTSATVSRVLATSEAGIASAETGTGVGSSSYVLKVVATGESGFGQTINSKENKVFVQIFRAWLPVGYKFVTATNGTGNGRKDEYLTNPDGTGKWEWYARTMYCGVDGTFSSTGYNYITRVSSDYDLPSAENPVTFYLAECNAYDITRGSYAGLRVRYADSSTGVTVTNDNNSTLYFTGVKSTDGTELFNTSGVTAKGTALSAGSVKATGLLESDTGIQINSNNEDKYITFNYTQGERYDWRIGYIGSGDGDANYFTIEGNSNTGTFTRALQIGATSFNSTFAGSILPIGNNSKDIGSSSAKWANVYATKFNGEATNVTTEADTTNALYVVGVTSGATTALKRDTSVTVTGGTLNATTLVGTTVKVGGSSGAILKYADSALQVRNSADSDWGAVKVGNLTVEGTITYINTQDLNVADNIITLNSDVTGTPSENAGIEIERGTSTNASLLWDESNDAWKAGLVGSEKTLAFADLSNISGTLTVAHGGTGTTSLTAYRLLVGNGTNSIGVLGVSSSGYVLVGAGTSANPTWKTLENAGIASKDHTHSQYINKDGSVSFTAGWGKWDANYRGMYRDVLYWNTISSTNQTGAIKIKVGSYSKTTRVIRVFLYHYKDNYSGMYLISGYSSTGSSPIWNGSTVFKSTDNLPDVRLVADASNFYILLGTTSTTWTGSLSLSVDVMENYNVLGTERTGWSAELITTEPTWTTSVTPTNNSGLNADMVDGKHVGVASGDIAVLGAGGVFDSARIPVLGVANGGVGLTSYTAGDMLYATDASTIGTLGIGTSGYVLVSSGSAPTWKAISNVISAANPTGKVGLTTVNGSATTFMRSDAAPALDVGIAPTWTGKHIFKAGLEVQNTNNDATKGLIINRTTLNMEYVSHHLDDTTYHIKYTNDEKANNVKFTLINTDLGDGGDGTGANTSTVSFTGSSSGSNVTATKFTGSLVGGTISGTTLTASSTVKFTGISTTAGILHKAADGTVSSGAVALGSEVSGTLPIGNLPAGTGSTQVAYGNHTHSQYINKDGSVPFTAPWGTWDSSNYRGVYRCLAEYGNSAASVTGTLLIKTGANTSSMQIVRIMLYNYVSNKSGEILVSGSTSSSNIWKNSTVYKSTDNIPDVRLLKGTVGDVDGFYIGIGNTDTSWKYLYVVVSEVVASYYVNSAYRTGWTIQLVTEEPTWTSTVTPAPNNGLFATALKALDATPRKASANIKYGDAGLHYLLASSSMTTGKPASDGHILHASWDTTSNWEGQLSIPTSANGSLQWRSQGGVADWVGRDWLTVLDDNNYNNYAPSLTGTGATGNSWDIGILGNAATATTATNVSGGTVSCTTLTASSTVKFSGITTSGVLTISSGTVGAVAVLPLANGGTGATTLAAAGIATTGHTHNYAGSTSAGGSATKVTTTSDTSSTLYVTGVKTGDLTTLRFDTSVTVAGGTLSATTGSISKIFLGTVTGSWAHGLSFWQTSTSGRNDWQMYIGLAGTGGCGVAGMVTAPTGTYVTKYAIRSLVSETADSGWTWESCPNGTTTAVTPTIRAELSNTGIFKAAGFVGAGTSITNLNAGNISTGTVSVERGGIGTGTLTGVAIGNGTSSFSGVAGSGTTVTFLAWTGSGYAFQTVSDAGVASRSIYADAVRDPDYHTQGSGGRRTSANISFADGALHYYLATSSMTTGKPSSDAHILHLSWDNGNYESQLAVPYDISKSIQWRGQYNSSTYSAWASVLDSNNYTTYTVKKDGTGATGTWPMGVYHDKVALNTSSWTAGSLCLIDTNHVDRARGNKFAFIEADKISISFSSDGGETWTDAGYSDNVKRDLFTGQFNTYVNVGATSGTVATNHQMKIEVIKPSSRYFVANQLYIWFGSRGHTTKVDMSYSKYNAQDTYTEVFTDRSISGNTGPNMYNFSNIIFWGTGSSLYRLRLVFRITGVSTNETYAESWPRVYGINAYGPTTYTSPNYMVSTDHLYTWDRDKNVIFPAQLKSATLNITGAGTVAGAMTLSSTLSVAGASTLTGAVTMKGNAEVQGILKLKASQYEDSDGTGSLNLQNSDIFGVNSIKFADKSDGPAEGLQWVRSTGTPKTVDSVWVKDGVMYITPNRAFGGTGTDYVFLTSGNYTDYVKNGTLNLQASGTNVATFTANQSGASTFNIATGSTNGTISVGGTDVAVKGLGSNAYTSTSYLPLGGGTMSDGARVKFQGKTGKTTADTQDILISGTSNDTTLADQPGIGFYVGNKGWCHFLFNVADGCMDFINGSINLSTATTINGYPVRASKFIVRGSSSAYVLLGDGTTAQISSLSVSSASSATNASNVSVTGLATTNTTVHYLTGVQTFGTAGTSENRPIKSTSLVTWTGSGALSAVSLTLSGLGSGVVRSSGGTIGTGAINLASSDVTDTLPVENGGIGTTTVTGVLIGAGTGAVSGVSTTTANHVLIKTSSGYGFATVPSHTHSYAGSSSAGGSATTVVSSASTSNTDYYITGVTAANGAQYYSTSVKFNASTKKVTATGFVGGLEGTATNATNASVTGIVTTGTGSSTVYYLTGVETFGTAGTAANRPIKSTKLVTWTGAGALSAVSLTLSGLGSGVVRASSGALSVGNVNLASEVSGILPVANGGIGISSISAYAIPYASAANTFGTISIGSTAGYVLAINSNKNGYEWVSRLSSVSTTANYSWSGTHTFTSSKIKIGTSGTGIVTASSGALSIFTVASGDAGKVLKVNSSGNGFEWGTASSGASSLSDLSDTTISSPASYQLLYYKNSTDKWTQLTAPSTNNTYLKYTTSGGLAWATITTGSTTLSGLTDTTISNPANNQILYYNGSKWTQLTAPSTANTYLKYDGSSLGWATVSSGAGATMLTQLSDVDIDASALTKGDLIWYDGTNFARVTKASTNNTYLRATVTGGQVTALAWSNSIAYSTYTTQVQMKGLADNDTTEYHPALILNVPAGTGSGYQAQTSSRNISITGSGLLKVGGLGTYPGVVYNDNTGTLQRLQVSGNGGKYLKVNSAGDGLEWGTPSGGGGGSLLVKSFNFISTTNNESTSQWVVGSGDTYVNDASVSINIGAGSTTYTTTFYLCLPNKSGLTGGERIFVTVHFNSNANTTHPHTLWFRNNQNLNADVIGDTGVQHTSGASGKGNMMFMCMYNSTIQKWVIKNITNSWYDNVPVEPTN